MPVDKIWLFASQHHYQKLQKSSSHVNVSKLWISDRLLNATMHIDLALTLLSGARGQGPGPGTQLAPRDPVAPHETFKKYLFFMLKRYHGYKTPKKGQRASRAPREPQESPKRGQDSPKRPPREPPEPQTEPPEASRNLLKAKCRACGCYYYFQSEGGFYCDGR